MVVAAIVIDRILHHLEIITAEAPATTANTLRSIYCRRQDRKMRQNNQRQGACFCSPQNGSLLDHG